MQEIKAEESFTKNLFEEDLHFVRKKQVLITLWSLGTQSTVLMTADRFGVTDFSVTRAHRPVVGALISVVPMVRGQIVQTIILDFQRTRGFPDVIGALDGTHIKIDPVDPMIQIYFSYMLMWDGPGVPMTPAFLKTQIYGIIAHICLETNILSLTQHTYYKNSYYHHFDVLVY